MKNLKFCHFQLIDSSHSVSTQEKTLTFSLSPSSALLGSRRLSAFYASFIAHLIVIIVFVVELNFIKIFVKCILIAII